MQGGPRDAGWLRSETHAERRLRCLGWGRGDTHAACERGPDMADGPPGGPASYFPTAVSITAYADLLEGNGEA